MANDRFGSKADTSTDPANSPASTSAIGQKQSAIGQERTLDDELSLASKWLAGCITWVAAKNEAVTL